MKDIFILTKVLFLNQLNNNKSKSKLGKYIVLFVLIVSIGFNSYESYKTLPLGYDEILLQMSMIGILFLLLFQNIAASMNLLFFSKDLDFLTALPIKSYKIIIAKFNCMYITNMFLEIIYYLPVVISYGIYINAGWMFYFIAAILFFTLSIIPLTLITILVSLIMKFTNFISSKDFMQYITTILSVLLILCIIAYLNNYDSQVSYEFLDKYSGIINGIVIIKWITDSLINYDNLFIVLINLRDFLLLTIGFYSICVFVLNKFYLDIVRKLNGKSSSKKNTKSLKSYKKKNVILSIAIKDFKQLFNNPIYLMQCVMPIIIFPLFIFSIFISSLYKGDQTVLFMFDTRDGITWFITRLFIMLLLYTFNYISVTAISREGQDALYMKFIPVSKLKQVIGKLIPGIVLNFIPVIGYVIFEILAYGKFDLSTEWILIILFIAFNICSNIFLLYRDLKNPKLVWTNEYAVVKQNINMFYNFVYTFLFVVISVIPFIITSNIYIYATIVLRNININYNF